MLHKDVIQLMSTGNMASTCEKRNIPTYRVWWGKKNSLSYSFSPTTPCMYEYFSFHTHTCHIPRPSHRLSFDLPTNICWIQIAKLLIMEFLQFPCQFLHFNYKHLPRRLTLDRPHPLFLPYCDTPCCTPTLTNTHNCGSVHFNPQPLPHINCFPRDFKLQSVYMWK